MHATDPQPASTGADWGAAGEWHWMNLSCHWRVLGTDNDPAIVLIHGFGASSSHWRHNAGALVKAGFQVFSLDLIGFGRSGQPGLNRRFSLDNRLWAEQLAAFLEDIVQRPAVLVGNSLGGLTAVTTAALRPELVRAAVAAPLPDPTLLNPLPQRQPKWLIRLQRIAVTLICRLLPLELIVPLIVRTRLLQAGLQGAYQRSIQSDLELQKLIAEPALRSTAPRSLRAMSAGMALRPRSSTAPFLLQRLQNMNNRPPLLLIWGRQDRFVPLMIGESVRHQHPWVDLQVIDDVGHCPHDETPELFHRELLHWLDRNLGGASAPGIGHQA